jgi:hypothetical protein
VTEVKRYKYQALLTLLPQRDGDAGPPVPGPACRMTVRAHLPDSQESKFFSALVSTGGDTRRGDPSVTVTMTVLGDDADQYLSPCADFTLWRGRDVARGVITRRVFV